MAHSPLNFLQQKVAYAGPLFAALTVLLLSCSFLVTLFSAAVLAHIVSGVIFETPLRYPLPVLLWTLVLLALVRFGFQLLSTFYLQRGAARIKARLRADLYAHIQALGPVFVHRFGTGTLVHVLTEAVDILTPYYTTYLPTKYMSLLGPLAVLFFVFPVDITAGFVLLFMAPLVPLFMIFIGQMTAEASQKQWQHLARLSHHLLDVVQGLPTLKLFGAAQREQGVVAQMAKTYRQNTLKILRLAFLSSLALEFFATISVALVAILVGFRLLWGTLDFETGFFVLLLAPEFFVPLRQLGSARHARMEAVAAAEKMMTLTACSAPSRPTSVQACVLEKPPHIVFDHVTFSYTDTPVLQDVSFDIPAGQHTALAGPSGAGKTTIMALLLGFIVPQKGDVFVDGTPLSHMDLSAWRSQLGWIPQNPTLFPATVLSNLQAHRDDISRETVETLCQQLYIDSVITALPKGYDTFVNEGGQMFSGGERQRLALVRAFARPAPLVLLDEPTASLDKETEAALFHAFQTLMAGKTVLSIAHRPSTLARADHIVRLHEGKVVS